VFGEDALVRFCVPLCDAVTGSADAAELIEVLERENLFLVPLDDNRQWYRYHHLFAQLLRSQLASTEPGIVPEACERLVPALGIGRRIS
jgi:LuxR family transcriptional regulator, maltose regulon positive regulatory protein